MLGQCSRIEGYSEARACRELNSFFDFYFANDDVPPHPRRMPDRLRALGKELPAHLRDHTFAMADEYDAFDVASLPRDWRDRFRPEKIAWPIEQGDFFDDLFAWWVPTCPRGVAR